MATYLELHSLRSNSDLQDKISVALVKNAQAILDSATPTAAEVSWASEAIANPKEKSNSLINYVLAANSSATTTQILGAADASIQSNVDAAVTVLINGGA